MGCANLGSCIGMLGPVLIAFNALYDQPLARRFIPSANDFPAKMFVSERPQNLHEEIIMAENITVIECVGVPSSRFPRWCRF
jgi:hypothetical protein